jgi:hypothetical protein
MAGAASGKILITVKSPVVLYSGGSLNSFTHILGYAVVDENSPLSGISLGIDVGGSFGSIQLCIAKDNISSYIYETVDGTFDALIVDAQTNLPGFVSLL